MRGPIVKPDARFPSKIDGVARSVIEERQIDSIVFDALGSGPGALLMEYLRGLTLRTVSGPEASDQELRHREGQRHLVWMLEARLKREKERT